MDAEFIDRPQVSYVMSSPEISAKKKACRRAYERFLRMRGKVLTETVHLERQLSRVVAAYFCPSLSREWGASEEDRKEASIRRKAFNDLVMGHPGVSWGTKVAIVRGIMDAAEIRRKPSPKPLLDLLRKVGDLRNRFAHARLAINWNTQALSLWNAEGRRWKRIEADEHTRHEQRCAKAWILLQELDFQVSSIRRGVSGDEGKVAKA
jgi:hypothetical protein